MTPFSRHASAESAVPWAAFVLGFVMARVAAAAMPGFPLDDAWIHLCYAKSLKLGEGLSYNPGDWEAGFSSPLWVLLLWLVPWDDAPVQDVAWVTAWLHGAGAFAVAQLARDAARTEASNEHPVPVLSIAAAAGVLAAASPLALLGAASGMEVSLTFAAVAFTTHAVFFGPPVRAGVCGALSVLARPESLVFVLALAAMAARRRPRPALAAAGGALAAMAAHSAYLLAVAGQPLPNTFYVKGQVAFPSGLGYLWEQVLPWQPEVVSLAGLLLLVLAAREERRRAVWVVRPLLAAVGLVWLAVAASRRLDPSITFYGARYYAPWAPLVTAAVPLGLIGARRPVLRALGVVLVAGAAAFQGRDLLAHGRAMAEDIAATHEAPARYVARELPPAAVVATEGAGALRFFTPRTMTIVDLVGLNDRRLARLHFDRAAKLCEVVRRRPDAFVIPTPWIRLFSPPFAFESLARFDDPAYVQVLPPRPHRVEVLRVRDIEHAARQRCR